VASTDLAAISRGPFHLDVNAHHARRRAAVVGGHPNSHSHLQRIVRLPSSK
jgi:hypothetical protein